MAKEIRNDKKEKCFVIMPISDQGDYPKEHFQKVYEQIFVPAIEEAGYEAFRVDEDNMCTPIVEKIFKAIQECPMALCDLSNRNPNVLYELGIRQAYDKPVVLVQDDKTDRIFDVSGINTISYSSNRLFEEVLDARRRITDAIISLKEGKQNSIIKVINAQSATVSSDKMSKEDKVEVMLAGLLEDVNDLKMQIRKNNVTFGENIWEKDYVDRKINISNNGTLIVELRNGVTNEQIQRAIYTASHRVGTEIDYHRKGNRIIVTYEYKDKDIGRKIYKEINAMIGKI